MSLSDHDDYSEFSEVARPPSFVGHGDASLVGQGFVLYIHLTDVEDDTEESDDASMPPLSHGYDSDETDTTLSTACDEAMVQYRLWYEGNHYRLWYEGNPSWIVNGPFPNRYQYNCGAVDWLSDADSVVSDEALIQALDDDPAWRVRDLEEDEVMDDGPPELMSSLLRLQRAEALQALEEDPLWEIVN
jgi:hypothetical protein